MNLPVPQKFICVLAGVLLFFTMNGQQVKSNNFSKQLSVITENDFYLAQGKDGYYTNGLMFNYTKIHHLKKAVFIKQADHFEIGQKLYTAFSRKIFTEDQIDRPITGYLYVQFLRSSFLKNEQILQWGASAGTIGKASLGEGMQDLYHKLIHINTSLWGWVWDYQLKSAFGVNLHAKYANALVKKEHSFVQITPVTQLTLGTIFTNASEVVLFQFGKLHLQSESAFWNAAVQNKQTSSGSEIFIYYLPQLTWQVYDATVQGGMFNKDKGPIVSSPKSFVLLQQVGGMYSFKRYSFRMAVTFNSKVATSQRFGNKYGSLQLNYRFN